MKSIIESLQSLSLEEIEEKIQEEDNLGTLQALIIAREFKKVLERPAQTYKEVVEKDLLLTLFYSALLSWMEEG
ncbi:MAG: hypothetical protein QW575_08060 [Thermoproteota archaeon]